MWRLGLNQTGEKREKQRLSCGLLSRGEDLGMVLIQKHRTNFGLRRDPRRTDGADHRAYIVTVTVLL